MNRSIKSSAITVLACVCISACSSTGGAGFNSPSQPVADPSAAAVGKAAIGDTISLPAGNPIGATSVDVISEYYAASNRRCRQVLPRGGQDVRIACEHGKGSWHWVRTLTTSEVAQPLPALVTVGAAEPVALVGDEVANSESQWFAGDVVTLADTDSINHSISSNDQRVSVEPGETLWSFSRRTTGSGVHWQAIAELNDIDDARTVTSYASLLVPAHLAIGQ